MSTAALPIRHDGVHLEGSSVVIDHLVVDDPLVAGYLAAVDPAALVDEVVAALSIGCRGLEAMGTGATAHRVGEVVERLVDDALARAEQRVAALLESGRTEMANALDPEVRSSVTARLMTELGGLHRELLDGIDPDRRDSRTAKFMTELDGFLGRGGRLEERLAAALDPTADDSALAAVVHAFEQRFQELRDLIVGSQARADESRRGTAKGFEFEDVVEARLRSEARHLGGAVVERTATEPGVSGAGALVGDFVVTLGDGTRVAVEAKHASRITLAGKDGILTELDRAMVNRSATWALCVSHDDAYPEEVGSFGIYGNRVLVVDDGAGDLLRVAIRWIATACQTAALAASDLDPERVTQQLDRLRNLATRFSRAKRGLGAIQSSIDGVRGELDELRTELVDGVDELTSELRHGAGAATPRMKA